MAHSRPDKTSIFNVLHCIEFLLAREALQPGKENPIADSCYFFDIALDFRVIIFKTIFLLKLEMRIKCFTFICQRLGPKTVHLLC